MESTSIQDYLKLLYRLNEEGKIAKTSVIAGHLDVSRPSVTEMLKKLAEKGYVTYESYRGAILTDKGREAAKKITRKHRLLECLLHDILKISKSQVHKEACRLEHALSDNAEEAICKLVHHPEVCPDDGKVIPLCNKQIAGCSECEIGQVETEKLRDKELVPLDQFRIGQNGVISFIRGGRKAVQRLLDMGLAPGTLVKVINAAPFKGPIEISVRDTNLVIGRGLAAKIFLERK